MAGHHCKKLPGVLASCDTVAYRFQGGRAIQSVDQGLHDGNFQRQSMEQEYRNAHGEQETQVAPQLGWLI